MVMYFWVTKYNAIDTYAFGLKRELIDGGDKPQHEGKPTLTIQLSLWI
jgi:hypothetical protein